VRPLANQEAIHLAVTLRRAHGVVNSDAMVASLYFNGALDEEVLISSEFNYYDNRTMWFGSWRKNSGPSRQTGVVALSSEKFSAFRVDPSATSGYVFKVG